MACSLFHGLNKSTSSGEVLCFHLQVWELGHPKVIVSSPARANSTSLWTLVGLQRDCHENVDFWPWVSSSKVGSAEPKKTARVKEWGEKWPKTSSKGPSSSASTARAREWEVRPLPCARHLLVPLFSPVKWALLKSLLLKLWSSD